MLGSRALRLLVTAFAVAGSVVAFGATATAHGDNCVVYAQRPYILQNDGRFHGVGGFECEAYQHARVRVRVDLMYSRNGSDPYAIHATDVRVERRAEWAEGDASVDPCDPGQGYYKTRTIARVFNADGELVHHGRYTSRRRALANCVG